MFFHFRKYSGNPYGALFTQTLLLGWIHALAYIVKNAFVQMFVPGKQFSSIALRTTGKSRIESHLDLHHLHWHSVWEGRESKFKYFPN